MKLSDINFLIIGATKGGTTWLQRSLQLDSAICMPDPELHYFSREYSRGIDWYLGQFPQHGSEKCLGEKSNSYLECAKAAARIRSILPHAKLVAQLRNPVERAYSDYCMLYRRGEVDRNITLHLDPRQAYGSRFLTGGLYYQQLDTYLQQFPLQQLLILLYEDIQSDPMAQLARVRSFLGLSAEPPSRTVLERVKDKRTPTISPAMRQYLRPLKPLVKPLRESYYFRICHRLLAGYVDYPPLSASLRQRLADYYAEDIQLLENLMRRELYPWSRENFHASS